MIYFLRHGLDDERFVGGHSDVPLTSEGIRQVKESLNFIKSSGININSIYSSDIKRAYETALIISEGLNIPIIQTSLLRELDKGILNGIDKKILKRDYKEFIDVKDICLRYPCGESMLDFYNRIKRDLDKILESDNSLIVTHRGVINMIYYLLENIPVDMNKERFGVIHASIHEYDSQLKKIKRIYPS